jgi:hypothetical protein
MDWAHLDSRHERVATVAALQGCPAQVTVPMAIREPTAPTPPATDSSASQATDPEPGHGPTGHGRRRRSPRAAAAAAVTVAAVGCALAVPLSASAARVEPAAASWKIVKTTHQSGAPIFTAITASSLSHAWAFEGLQAGTSKPIEWSLSGSTWTKVSFPGHSREEVTAAGSTSASDAWTITSNGSKSRALRWNGSGWTATGSFNADLGNVTVISPTDVWAFDSLFSGPGGAWHYNGHSWSPDGSGLFGGSALSSHSVWAFGATKVAHWNGHAWSRTSVKSLLPPDSELNVSGLTGIYAQSSNSVWATGSGFTMDEGGPTVLLHYNGHNWSRVAEVGSDDEVAQSVIPDGHGGLWIPVPSSEGRPFVLLHYSGGHLRTTALPVSGNKLNVLDLAAVPHSTSAFGAGFTHQAGNPGLGIAGAILEYKR